MEDRRCKLRLLGRHELVLLVEQGSHRWWHRWQASTDADRSSLTCLRTRSSRPHSCPWALSSEEEQAILTARAKTNCGPLQLQFLTGRHRSTIHKVLARHGVSRRRRTQRPQSTRRYEWAEAGALLHIDAFELPRFERPGHWATGRGEQHKTPNAGKVKIVGVLDDHTRLAYCEVHGAEDATAVSATLRRAAAWMLEQGCGPVQAVMSDNALCYVRSHKFRDILGELHAHHIRIPPYTPRWNGKIERFFQTLDCEWAHSRTWPTSATRDHALSSFMRYYNRRRPHTAAAGQAPITRVQHLREQHT